MSKSDKYAGKSPVPVQRALQPDTAANSPSKKRPNKKALAAKRKHKKLWSRLGSLRHMTGDRCYVKPILNKRYDAYYCPKCLIWLEAECDHTENCEICKGRTSVRKALIGDNK